MTAQAKVFPYTHENGYIQDYGRLKALSATAYVSFPTLPAAPTYQSPATYQQPAKPSPNVRLVALVKAKSLTQFVAEETAAGIRDGCTNTELLPHVRELQKIAAHLEKQLGTGPVLDLVARLLKKENQE